jgi:uncharacterized protein
VKVRVVDVDIARKRIGLSMRRDANAGSAKPGPRDDNRKQNPSRHGHAKLDRPASQGSFGAALAEALRKR